MLGPGRDAPGRENDVTDLATEEAHLEKSERDIADGERRVSAQALLVERLRAGGHDTGTAEALLMTLQQTLEGWRAHREEILRSIARLQAEGWSQG